MNRRPYINSCKSLKFHRCQKGLKGAKLSMVWRFHGDICEFVGVHEFLKSIFKGHIGIYSDLGNKHGFVNLLKRYYSRYGSRGHPLLFEKKIKIGSTQCLTDIMMSHTSISGVT
jgi:hypothetical protein